MIRPFPLFAACAAFALCIASLSAAGPRYAATQLRAFSAAAGAYASVTDINDHGVAVGADWVLEQTGEFLTPRYQNALLWSATSPVAALPLPSGTQYGRALSINNANVVAGQSRIVSQTFEAQRATVFTTAGATIIPPSTASLFAVATDVNDAGAIVGTDEAGPFVYRNGIKTVLSPNSTTFTANDALVSPNGVIYANGTDSFTSYVRPFRVDSATARQALYTDTSRYGFAADVNNKEQLVGAIARTIGPYADAAALFANGNITLLPDLGGTWSVANSINDRGVIVGQSAVASGNAAAAFVLSDGAITNLNTLLPTNSGWTLREAISINNLGQIVGNGLYDDDHNAATPAIRAAFRLDPIRSAGDSNYDNVVDFRDLVVLAQNYNKSGNGEVFFEGGDFNLDQSVDFKDLVILAQNYSNAAAFASDYAAVLALMPEPSSVCPLATGVLLLRRRRSTRKYVVVQC